jgi:hypothetical protein
MLLGAPLLLLIAVGSVWITIAWLFARVPGLVYDFAPWQRSALHLLYEGFVTPIANKFIVPLLLALAFAFFRSPARGRASTWRAPPAALAGSAAEAEAGAPAPSRPAAPPARSSRRRRKR